MDLCQYKNILGEPNIGIHSYRLFNIAIMDVIITVIGSYLLSRLLKLSFKFMTIFLFFLGVVIHRLFCVRTTIDKLLFN